MRAPVTSVKHYIQKSLSTVTAGTNLNIVLVEGSKLLNVNLDQDVIEGAVVKAVFVEMWARSGDVAAGSVLMTLVKVPNFGSITFAEQVALNGWDNKKNILYHTQGNSNDQDANATPFVRQWFKIPKGKQRFGLGDKLVLSIAAQALDQIICGFATYKEYT